MKKYLALVMALVLSLSLVACGSSSSSAPTSSTSAPSSSTSAPTEAPKDAPKFGVVLVGDENEGYTYAHILGVKEAMKALGVSDDQVIWKYNIPEDETCYDTCIDLVEEGCSAIFTNSYSHQTYAQQAASENPDVQFVSLTGDTAMKSGLNNFSNAFNKTFESRYVSGVVAGMKVAELVADDKLTDANMKDGKVKIGYVGAYPYAEVMSGFTGFFLGIQSVYPDVVMEVTYTNSWFDLSAEAEAAKMLVSDGCVIVGQHADSTGAPSAIQELLSSGTVCYSVGYNIDMLSVAPDAALTSSTNDWGVYYTYAIGQVLKGEKIVTDWSEGYETGAVAITALGNSCAAGTAEKVAEVEAAIKEGKLHVFDTSTFTVNGEHLTQAFGFDSDGDWVYDTFEAITDGYYHESEYISAPSFNLPVDGIISLN